METYSPVTEFRFKGIHKLFSLSQEKKLKISILAFLPSRAAL